jgi:ubiquinone/menaquinone biosynthesis C-methylase UbiE
MRRVVIPELLDSDEGSAEDIRAGLADLRKINSRFGGLRTTRVMIESVVHHTGRRELSLLEVASASGDVPLYARSELSKAGITLNVTLLDRAPSHLNGFRPSVVGDALSLPFRDGSFDLVSCGLFAHHLEPDELIAFAREALRVCRLALLINDLRRSALHLALVYAGLPLFQSRLTRHDAPASVRRAYTVGEMQSLLLRAGAAKLYISKNYLFRMAAIAWKNSKDVQSK